MQSDKEASTGTANKSGVANPADVIMVTFTGGINGDANTKVPVDGGDTSSQIGYNVLAEAEAAGLRTFSTVISAGNFAAPAVNTGYNYIKGRWGPSSKVLIYGYSRGGDCAAELAHKLNGDNIPVDILITVDGALGPLSATHVEREIPPNVRFNMNQYQRSESRVTSRGDENYPSRGNNATRIDNVNMEDHTANVTHGNIDEAAEVVNTNLLLNAAGVPVNWDNHNYAADANSPDDWKRNSSASSSDNSSDTSSSGSSSGSGSSSYRDRDSSSSDSSY